jgi:[protein-PII] uridylyltransferase
MMKIAPQDDGLIDIEQTRQALQELVENHDGKPDDFKLRGKILALFKERLGQGRKKAEEMLFEDGSGILCAIRLSYLEDCLIRLIYDFATRYVYRVVNPSDSEKMAVIAVGGYGRATLGPQSDIDLLFLLPYKQTAWGESVVEYILYMLWDLGQKVGHSTRTLDDCVRLSKTDMTIRTALLEARPICGEQPLYDALIERYDKEVMQDTGSEFMTAKLAERDARHAQQGNSRYMVEPNVKEGKGGLRDLHSLFWIGQYVYRVRRGKELIEAGVFTAKEYGRFKRTNDFLWTVRCHLHFLTRRDDERLIFDLLRELA